MAKKAFKCLKAEIEIAVVFSSDESSLYCRNPSDYNIAVTKLS